MKISKHLALPCLLCAAALFLAGCKDEAAQRRAQIQTVITEAGLHVRKATVTPLTVPVKPAPDAGPEDQDAYNRTLQAFNARRRQLDDVIRDLAQVRDGEPGQQAAGALLATTAHCELAAMSLAQAQIIEARHRHERLVIHSRIDAAMRLLAQAHARQALNTAEQRAMLVAERDRARQQIIELSQRRDELRQPIAERETLNRQDLAKASSLDDEAAALKRQATELGRVEGLASFEQAVRLERQADQFTHQVAQRQNDLAYEFKPEHQLATARLELLEAMLDDIAAAEHTLDDLDSHTTDDVRATLDMIARFREQLDAELDAVTDASADELQALYQQSGQAVDKALTQARNAVSKSTGAGKNPARLAHVRASALKGKARWAEARGLADHLGLLSRLIEAGDALGSTDRFHAEFDAISTRHDEAVNDALDAFNDAKQQLEQLSGRDNAAQLRAYKINLQHNIAAITGEPVEIQQPERPTGTTTPASTAANSPDDLLAFLTSITPGDLDAEDRFLDLIRFSTDVARQMVQFRRAANEMNREFVSVVEDRFGAAAMSRAQSDLAASMGLNLSAFPDARIDSRTDTRVTVRYTHPLEGESTFDLVLIDGSWMIDGDSLFAAVQPALPQQLLAALPMTRTLMNDILQRVRDGEFATVEEIMEAIVAEAMNAAGGATPPDK